MYYEYIRRASCTKVSATSILTYLDEHLGSRAEFGLLDRLAVGAHRFAVARELESELLLPHGLDVLIAHCAYLLLRQSGFTETVDVHLLAQDGQRRLSRLADLFKLGLRL